MKRRYEQPKPPASTTNDCVLCGEEKTFPPDIVECSSTDLICEDCMDRLGLDRCPVCVRTVDAERYNGVCEEHYRTCRYSEDCDEQVHPNPMGPTDDLCDEHQERWERERERNRRLEWATAHAAPALHEDQRREHSEVMRRYSWEDPADHGELVQQALEMLGDDDDDFEFTEQDVREFVGLSAEPQYATNFRKRTMANIVGYTHHKVASIEGGRVTAECGFDFLPKDHALHYHDKQLSDQYKCGNCWPEDDE